MTASLCKGIDTLPMEVERRTLLLFLFWVAKDTVEVCVGYKSRNRFQKFFNKSKKLRGRHFNTFVFPKDSEQEEGLELSYMVLASKKGVHKRAVKRNRAKRRIKAAVLEFLKENQGLNDLPYHIGFMAYRTSLECPWEEITSDVQETLIRIHKKYKAAK